MKKLLHKTSPIDDDFSALCEETNKHAFQSVAIWQQGGVRPAREAVVQLSMRLLI